MTTQNAAPWPAADFTDPAQREALIKSAARAETTCATVSALLAIVAVWAFTASPDVLDGRAAAFVGGPATLGFSIFFTIAAVSGAKKRILTLLASLGSKPRA